MFIGIYSPEAGRDYSGAGETIEEVVRDIENQVEEYGEEVFDDTLIAFYRADPLNVRKQYMIIE